MTTNSNNNNKKKKNAGKHRARPVGGFSDEGPRGMSPPPPPPSFAGAFPSQPAPHSSDDHDQQDTKPPVGGTRERAASGGGDGVGGGAKGSGGAGGGDGQWGKPTLHLQSSIEGLFKEQDHVIGGSYSDAALEHWRQLDSPQKLEVVTVSRDGIFDALRELHLTSQVEVEGEPGEEAAQGVVKDFLYALEVQDGKFRFPESPSLEYIGIFVALETNLLLSMEETNLIQHASMVWFVLLWRQRFWWLFYLLTLAVVLGNHRWCQALRGAVRRFLTATFLERRRWHAYVHWKTEAFFVSLLAIAMAAGGGWSPRWYWTAVGLALGELGLDVAALRTCDAGKGDEQTGAVALRQALLWAQKVLLLVVAYPAWTSFGIVLFYYFPAAAVLGLSLAYLAVGLGFRLLWGLLHEYALARLAPRAKAGLDAWWHEGRDGLNRALVVAVVALLMVPYVCYETWQWAPAWKGTSARLLSLLLVANVVSLEDLQRAWAAGKAGLGGVLGRGWRRGKAEPEPEPEGGKAKGQQEQDKQGKEDEDDEGEEKEAGGGGGPRQEELDSDEEWDMDMDMDADADDASDAAEVTGEGAAAAKEKTTGDGTANTDTTTSSGGGGKAKAE